MAYENHWLPGFNFNVEEWDVSGQNYETLAICRTLEVARAAFKAVVEEKPCTILMRFLEARRGRRPQAA
jgi:benzoyl-CoA reductase/2-hydroxyglutaryl-CoA dehydratase subunit BcrC/BadD/HgdB